MAAAMQRKAAAGIGLDGGAPAALDRARGVAVRIDDAAGAERGAFSGDKLLGGAQAGLAS